MGQQHTPDPPGPVDRGRPETPSEQIGAIVRARITSGQYAPGARLPSTTTLAQEFGVATRTVRKGLAPLLAEGLIDTRPGWGTFAAKP